VNCSCSQLREKVKNSAHSRVRNFLEAPPGIRPPLRFGGDYEPDPATPTACGAGTIKGECIQKEQARDCVPVLFGSS
jgi:hypothetical protein